MRLTDGHNYNIEEAAKKVGVSRSTAGRMLERARRAIALGFERRAPVYLDASEELILTPPEPGDESTYSESQALLSTGSLAIACENTKPGSPVERMFGRATGFVIIDSDGTIQAHVKNPGANLKRNAANTAIKSLKEHGVSRVVAGRFGSEAIKTLASEAMQPLVANGFSLKQAIELFNR